MGFHGEVEYGSSQKSTNTTYVVILEFDGDPGADWLNEAIQRNVYDERQKLIRGFENANLSTKDIAKLTGIRVTKK